MKGGNAMLSVLIIGAGTMGRTHTRAYQQMENVHIAGIVDIQKPDWLKHDPLAISFYSSWEDAIDQIKQIDVVDICLPTFLHKEYVMKAAGLGKHVICEKPIARTLDDAKEMIDFCNRQGVQLFIGHVVRFFPEYRMAKSVIQSKAIGTAKVVKTSRKSSFPSSWNDWYSDQGSSGGLILDLVIHDFDFLRWCFGEVERVYGKSLYGKGHAGKEYALITLRFKNGMIAQVEGSWSHQKFATSFEFAGDKGAVEYDSTKERPFVAALDQKLQKEPPATIPRSPIKESPYYKELAHFMECIEKRSEPLVTPEDGLQALRIALAAIQSIAENRPVEIEEQLLEIGR
ncbi:Gfo/Idh/MocA family protein [Oceanobacillus kapialis]|uniref:Gfo/Idh/MocA family protein n=1 Tax=Oceanobacillus kapialis TaxID=481353 RepID=UPI00384BB36C